MEYDNKQRKETWNKEIISSLCNLVNILYSSLFLYSLARGNMENVYNICIKSLAITFIHMYSTVMVFFLSLLSMCRQTTFGI